MAEKKKTEIEKEEVKETPKKKSTTKKTTADKKAPAEKKPAAKKATSEKKPAAKKATSEKKTPAKKTTKKSEKAEDLEALVKELPGEEIPLNVNPEDDEKIPLDPETGLDPEKLEAELNDLKDLVQDEIDKMMEENPDSDWKEIVKEAKDNKKKSKNSKEIKYCECCGDNEVDEDEIYCESCLKTMKHYPFEWWKLFIPVITIILFVLCLSYFAISYTVFADTVAANKLVKEGKLYSALTSFNNTNVLIKVSDDNFGFRYLDYQVDLYNKLGIDYYEDFSDFIDKYYAGTKINKWYAKDAAKSKEKITSYQKLYTYFTEAQDISDDYASFIENFDAILEGKNMDEALTYYYKYYAGTLYGEDNAVLRENIDKVKEIDPDAKSLYLPLLAELAIKDQNYDEVLKYANELSNFDCENEYAYLYKAIAYRLQGNVPKAIAACNEGLDIDPTNSFLNYQMTICCLLQGKNEEAYQYVGTAYQYAETVNAYVSAASLYSLCAQLNDDPQVNEAIIDDLTSYGYTISGDVGKIISGETTVEKVFMEGTGDLTWES